MNTTKKGVRIIAEICRQRGIRKIIFSPGSRSAPLVIAFSQIPEIECIVIPDERSAGYFALGMAQQLHETVVIVCTSGTAVANLFPAVCEAYYQNIPLLILSADRPTGAVVRGDNQSIMQQDIFGYHAIFNCSIDGDAETLDELKEIIQLTHEAIDETILEYAGPVQINIRMGEPLYEMASESLTINLEQKKTEPDNTEFISLKDLQRIKRKFTDSHKKMIIVGLREYDEEFNEKLQQLNERSDLIIINENISNLHLEDTVWNVDASLSLMNPQESELFIPDAVVTLGGQIVSKKIKQFLQNKPDVHWDVPPGACMGRGWNMFGEMFDVVEPVNEKQFLNLIIETNETEETNFKNSWLKLSKKAKEVSEKYFQQTEFSDLKVFEILNQNFPAGANIQYGNSTPIRYSNFFKQHRYLSVNANRGTSGIDGCVSTAAGAAYANRKMTICVVGDVSFFYDSNALWNNYLSPNFRIIIINNSGGNIFRLLDEATRVNNFEKFFETKHQLTAKHLASMYELPYYFCQQQNELQETLKDFFSTKNKKASILEIKTNGEVSAAVYKKYFEYLKAEGNRQ